MDGEKESRISVQARPDDDDDDDNVMAASEKLN